jgi:hypothetical protein
LINKVHYGVGKPDSCSADFGCKLLIYWAENIFLDFVIVDSGALKLASVSQIPLALFPELGLEKSVGLDLRLPLAAMPDNFKQRRGCSPLKALCRW